MATVSRRTQMLLLARKEARRRAVVNIGWTAVVYFFLITLAVATIFPFFWMVSTSLKVRGEELTWPIQWIPSPPTLDNYYNVIWGYRKYFPFVNFVANSAYIACIVVVGRVIVCAMGGYAFARLDFVGKKVFFAMLIASLFMPGVAMIIPLFQAYYMIGWIDTHLPLIVPGIFASTFGTFLMRQFFMTLPAELDDAARMDGASYFDLFWRIALPLTKPALAALAIFTFQGTWNNFETPRIFILSLDKQTLPVGLQTFNNVDDFDTQYGLLMAGATIAVLPVLVVYSFLQRYFVQGIALTGIKG